MISRSIDLAGVNLDLYEGPIGISASGGADSSILLYNLMKYKSDDKIHIFTTGTNSQYRYNIKVIGNVIEKCIQLTGNSNIEHHIKYNDLHSTQIVFSDVFFYLENNVINIMYTGVTENPPKEVTDKFLLPTTEDERAPGSTKPYLFRDGKIYTPFFNSNKKKIAEMYQEDNLMEELFPVTRSCEPWEDVGLRHCGKCWWCEERQWAFGRLV